VRLASEQRQLHLEFFLTFEAQVSTPRETLQLPEAGRRVSVNRTVNSEHGVVYYHPPLDI
jgi:hypothetical protein